MLPIWCALLKLHIFALDVVGHLLDLVECTVRSAPVHVPDVNAVRVDLLALGLYIRLSNRFSIVLGDFDAFLGVLVGVVGRHRCANVPLNLLAV